MSARRLIIAAGIGGMAATASTLLVSIKGMLSGVTNILFGTAIAAIMVRVAFGKSGSIPELIRESVMLWGSGALLGGIMTVVLSLGEPMDCGITDSYAFAFVISSFASVGIVRLFSARAVKRSLGVTVSVGEDRYSFDGLCDSGSFATEPISGLPVIIVKSRVLPSVIKRMRRGDGSLRVRIIPVKGVGGEAVLFGFVADEITVGGAAVSAVIGIDETEGSFAGQMAIIPSALCKRQINNMKEVTK